ncbi:MAG: pyruvate ferredoxin oxidoreductase [Prevotellaceae bacterium]|nr:pyruvate ferredoxin oxidoreductase [Candidatus Minthosoma caballi]
MNYQYIEQLLERYFDCETTLQEEQILRSFFEQEDVPEELQKYAELFKYETESKQICLGEDFDKKMMDLIQKEETPRKARVLKMHPRLAPFFKAAAVVAIALTIGNAAERAIGEHDAEEYAGSNAVAVDPYIKSSDIRSTLKVKDVSQAETKAINDSILSIKTEKDEVQ